MKKAIILFAAAALVAFAIVLAVLQQRAPKHQAQIESDAVPAVQEAARPTVKPPVQEIPTAPEPKSAAPLPEPTVVEEQPAPPAPVLPPPPAVTPPPPTPAPAAAKAPKKAKAPGGISKKEKDAIDSANAAVPLPLAREALGYVGMDPKADAVWFMAINDPEMSAHARKDLIEDLNEDGFADPKHPTPDELPLIESRIQMIEEIGPYAMDKVNYEAFQEAYKDLIEMYWRMQK